jgi:hypothetical protein
MAIALAALLAVAAPAAPRPQRFALVIGHNDPPHEGLPRLRYGDDDAVRWAMLLRTLGARVELLATLDAESRQLYGDRAPAMRPPARGEVRAAMARLGEAVRAAHAAGARTVFYFIYAGHGDVDEGEGYVALADGRLTRRDLEEMILGASGADTNHVVVDACRSYYLVYDRGPGGTRRPWTSPYFVSGAAARFRNTGFLLASSSEAPTHEWEEFQAGVFSHEVRSGLLGSADVDGDGRISYEEIAAFVRVANRPIRNAKYRPDFLARPPQDGDGVFMDLADAAGGAVEIGKRPSARYLLEDQLGVRWADLHPGGGVGVTLRLPVAPWSPDHFFFRQAGSEQEYRVPAGERGSLAEHTPVPAATTVRGAAHEAFAQLFAEPFDGSALRTPALDPEIDAAPPPPRHLATLVTLAAGGVALGASAALTIAGLVERHHGLDAATPGEERAAVNDRLHTLSLWRNATALAGAALAGAAVGLHWHDRARERVTVLPTPGGAVAAIRF